MKDALLQVDTERSVTAFGSIEVSVNAIPLSHLAAYPRDIGQGEQLVMKFKVTTAFTGASLMQFGIIVSDQATLAGGTGIILAMTSPLLGLTGTDLAAGSEFTLPIPMIPQSLIGTAIGLQYLGGTYFTVAGPFTTGAFSAWVERGTSGTKPAIHPIGYQGP